MARGRKASVRELRRGRTLVVLTVVAMLGALLVAAPAGGNENQPPVAVDDYFTGTEDTSLVMPLSVILSNDSDPDGDPVSWSQYIGGIEHGATYYDGSVLPGEFLYVPNPDFCGADSFVIEVTDGNLGYDQSTVFITVTCVNDPPVANSDSAITLEDTPVTVDVLGNDVDSDGDVLSVATATDGTWGETAPITSLNTITYTPDPDYHGSDYFTYMVCDTHGACDWGTVFVTVTAVNDPPVADANGPYVGIIGVPVSFDGSGSSDPDGDPLTYDWDFGDGSLAGTGAGPTPTHTYEMAASYTVALTVTDGGGLTDTATATAIISLGSGSFDAVEATIEGMGLESAGFEISLLKKIQNAQKSFDTADGEVCEKLASFIAAVNAQDGKKLTTEQADLLRSQAEAIGDAYGCDA